MVFATVVKNDDLLRETQDIIQALYSPKVINPLIGNPVDSQEDCLGSSRLMMCTKWVSYARLRLLRRNRILSLL